MSLNDAKIRSLKPTDKPFKVSDSHGLYLLVKPGGSRLWYLKYRINGKESRIALGAYPAVSLSDARQQREGIRKMLALNINPAQQRAAERGSRMQEKMFKSVALSGTVARKMVAEYRRSRACPSEQTCLSDHRASTSYRA